MINVDKDTHDSGVEDKIEEQYRSFVNKTFKVQATCLIIAESNNTQLTMIAVFFEFTKKWTSDVRDFLKGKKELIET